MRSLTLIRLVSIACVGLFVACGEASGTNEGAQDSVACETGPCDPDLESCYAVQMTQMDLERECKYPLEQKACQDVYLAGVSATVKSVVDSEGNCWEIPANLIPRGWRVVDGSFDTECRLETYQNYSLCSEFEEAAEIGEPCNGSADCSAENLYCETPVGECGAVGHCNSTDQFERADGCEECDGWCNVCGCDGVTYANLCAAQNAGASVAYYGKCDGESCTEDVECQTDSYPDAEQSRYCAQPEGVCRTNPQE